MQYEHPFASENGLKSTELQLLSSHRLYTQRHCILSRLDSLRLQCSAVTSRFMTFLTSCLGVILQVRARDGMSTPQNGAAAYCTVSRITYLPGWFSVAFPAVVVFLSVLLR